jgi:hypothetical protein
MNQDIFWQIIETACRSDRHLMDEWHQLLIDELILLSAADIIESNHIFDRMVAAAYTMDLIAACNEINGGAGADGFYYFRCWLVGMGKEVYSRAVVTADSLADVVSPEWCQIGDAESEIYWVAHAAWMQVTGNSDEVAYPARNERAKLIGKP